MKVSGQLHIPWHFTTLWRDPGVSRAGIDTGQQKKHCALSEGDPNFSDVQPTVQLKKIQAF